MAEPRKAAAKKAPAKKTPAKKAAPRAAAKKAPAKRAPAKRTPRKAPAPPPKKTVSSAAAADNPRDILVAMRARVASDIDNAETPARDIAALTRRLMEIIREIEAIDSQNGDGDEVTKAAQTPDEPWDQSSI